MARIGGKCYSCFVGEHACRQGRMGDCACRRCDPGYNTLVCGYCGTVHETEKEFDKCPCDEAIKARRLEYEIELADARRKGE